MQPFERVLYSYCPECRGWFRAPGYEHDSNDGASLYTDGLMEIPDNPDLSFGVCSDCNTVSSFMDWHEYLLDDQEFIHDKFVTMNPATFSQAFAFCQEESQGGVGVRMLAMLRFYLWQLGNDVRRNGTPDLPLSPDEESNLLKFLGLTHNQEEFAITRGLALRALGRFDEAIETLEASTKETKMDRLIASRNIELAIARSTGLGTVWFGTP